VPTILTVYTKSCLCVCTGIWIHCEGESTPEYDANGFVTAPDREGSLILDLAAFLDVAAANNVFVVPVLWNGALMRTDRYKQMIMDEAKTKSYLDNVLVVLGISILLLFKIL